MPTYKTPDVYVEEISIFPPSVAEVETAIPAFIGYTEKATQINEKDLLCVPTPVVSLLEFEELFGGAPPNKIDQIVLDENKAVSSFEAESTFYMYDSLRLFFKNGGGKCYIISIGLYKDKSVQKSHFEDGLKALKKKDEPTIILFPDAVLLEGDLYSVQTAALSQCNNLKDRFLICDLLEKKAADSTFNWEAGVDDFRNNIGMNYLKYGAAYTPWLVTNLEKDIHYRDVAGKIRRWGSSLSLKSLTTDTEVISDLTNLDNIIDDLTTRIEGDIDTLKGSSPTLKAKYLSLIDTLKQAPAQGKFQALFTFIYSIVDHIDDWAVNGTYASLTADIKNMIFGSLKSSMEKLIAYDRGADNTFGQGGLYSLYKNISVAATEWGDIFVEATAPTADTSIYPATGTATSKYLAAEPSISLIFSQVNTVYTEILETAKNYESFYESKIYESHPVYKGIINSLSKGLSQIPPSGAVAGVYAMIDSNRGVWKAPANVSLDSVIDVTESIDNSEQESLNVDVDAGKSINAIRIFTGRGVMIWGARTLAGNDNEWRYISVRRFFNMVEESVKKSTYWAVFEANDANTWIKVKSMIENYLIQKWRDGALAGSKPDDAFYVKVGLGLTMTAQDILEGRMNIEIGMAVVRPAEFIILKFSHKMQVS